MTPPEVKAAGPRGRLFVLAPMRLEARAVGAGAPRATVVRTGIGPRRAGRVAQQWRPLVDQGLAGVAVVGVCGSLRRDLQPGDLVVADAIVDGDGNPVVAPMAPAQLVATALRRAGLHTHVGAVASTDHLVRGRSERNVLSRRGALAVEMEGAALLREPWGLPSVMVRAVVDTPAQELFSAGTLRGGRMALLALRSAAAVLETWADALGPHRLTLVSPSLCHMTPGAVWPERDLLMIVGASPSPLAERLVDQARRGGGRAEFCTSESSLDLAAIAGTPTIALIGVTPADHALIERVTIAIGDLGPLDISHWPMRTETNSIAPRMEVS